MTAKGSLLLAMVSLRTSSSSRLVSVDGSTNITIKIPQLRNEYLKTGFNCTKLTNNAGFGVLHDGSVDSLDLDMFVQMLLDPAAEVAEHPRCNAGQADLNHDGSVDADDIQMFINQIASQ